MNARTVCYHEAAHAVMCLSVGISFQNVSTIPSGKYRGYLETGGYQINGLWELVGALETLMAGFIAQSAISQTPPKIEDMKGEDRMAISKLLHKNSATISGAEQADFMAWIFKRTEHHLRQRWTHVERIAAALQVSRSLSYDECKELMKAEPVG